MFHVRQDDKRHLIHSEADPSEGQHVSMVEILHSQGFINKLLDIYVTRVVLYK